MGSSVAIALLANAISGRRAAPGGGSTPSERRAAGQSCMVSLIRGRAAEPTVVRMPEFLAETYIPRGAPSAAARPADQVC
jgi:hypothetical protein